MASPTTVSTPEMHSGATTIRDSAGDLTTQSKSVENNVNQLMATFKGAAANGFNEALLQFVQECDGIIAIIKDLADAVDQSANQYDGAANDAAQSAKTLSSQISSVKGLSGF